VCGAGNRLSPHILCPRSPQNGSIYTVVPQKLCLFKAPRALPVKGATYLHIDGERHFSAAFYADLLRDLGVSLVVALGRVDYDRATMERAGIAVCTAADLGCLRNDARLSFQVRVHGFLSALTPCLLCSTLRS
jgi:hypothetical protein